MQTTGSTTSSLQSKSASATVSSSSSSSSAPKIVSKQLTLFGSSAQLKPTTKPMDLKRLAPGQQLWGRFYNEWLFHNSFRPTVLASKAHSAYQTVKKGFEGKKEAEAVEAWIAAKAAIREAQKVQNAAAEQAQVLTSTLTEPIPNQPHSPMLPLEEEAGDTDEPSPEVETFLDTLLRGPLFLNADQETTTIRQHAQTQNGFF